MSDKPCVLDHVLIGAPSLAVGNAWFRDHCAIATLTGGSHPGRGTRNELLPLEGGSYIELLAPDPAQTEGSTARAVLERLPAPCFTWWCLRSRELEGLRERLLRAGIPCSAVLDGHRRDVSGQEHRWRLLFPQDAALGCSQPFFIDWGGNEAPPAQLDGPRLALTSLKFQGPGVDALARLLEIAGFEDSRLELLAAAENEQALTLATPAGELTVPGPGCFVPALA